MNTTSKASNAFEAFFGIHELPPPRILSSSLKAWKLHWHNPMTNIGIDIIGIRISQQRHGVSTTRTRLTQKKHVTPYSRSRICLSLSHSLTFCSVSLSLSLPLFRHHQYISSRQNVYTKVTIVRTAPSIVTTGVPSLRDQIRPWWWYQKNGELRVYEILPPLLVEDAHSCLVSRTRSGVRSTMTRCSLTYVDTRNGILKCVEKQYGISNVTGYPQFTYLYGQKLDASFFSNINPLFFFLTLSGTVLSHLRPKTRSLYT